MFENLKQRISCWIGCRVPLKYAEYFHDQSEYPIKDGYCDFCGGVYTKNLLDMGETRIPRKIRFDDWIMS